MSYLPKIALIGRPNVGKSALFNRLCGKRLSIVEETAGVTRDRLYTRVDGFKHPCLLIDTGGLDSTSSNLFQKEIGGQTEIAIQEADSLIFVVDGKEGPCEQDHQIAKILLKTKKSICLAINKIDTLSQDQAQHLFYGLGIKKMLPVSALHGLNVYELAEMALEGTLSPPKTEIKNISNNSDQEAIRIALIGRPNVGKSTLLNHLINEDRSIVSPIAGTTRDSIDASLEINGQNFIFVDTAGIRKKGSEKIAIDKFASIRTEDAIEKAHICLLLLEAQSGLTSFDRSIARKIEEAGKGCILLLNKWDIVKGFRMEHCLKSLQEEHPFIAHAPTLCISALHGRNIEKIFPLIQKLHKETQRRISTGQLNRFIEKTQQKYHPPMIGGKRLRIFYLTQVSSSPPHFILFVNHPRLMSAAYTRYVINSLREEYGFSGVPFCFHLKARSQRSFIPD
jgi:GTPase